MTQPDLRDKRLSAILLGTLVLTGCPSTWNCNPESETYDLDEPVTAADVDAVVQAWGLSSWDEVECEMVCTTKYQEVRGWETYDVDSCTLELPTLAEDTGDEGEDGSVQCAGTGFEYYCEGRRPMGHVDPTDAPTDPLGAALAGFAHLERVSVGAFEDLALWLEARGAPEELVGRCLAAARDERDHARWMAHLAEARGVALPQPVCEEAPGDLLSVALHNAVEGCVNETWAALAAHVRAEQAADPRLRTLFARIAQDETRHGQLAWDLHRYLMSQLSPAQQAQVEAARLEALSTLPERVERLGALVPEVLGQPRGAQARALAATLAVQLAA